VNQADEDQVMTEYLLGGLSLDEREQVADRLALDPVYFEAMAALEDDLLERWHLGRLTSEQEARFSSAYGSDPARRARAEAAGSLLDAVTALKEAGPAEPVSWWSRGAWRRAVAWCALPSKVPRLALAAAGALVVAAAVVLWSRDGVLDRRVVFAVTLTAVGERGPGAAQGMDRIRLAPDVDELRLTIDLDRSAATDGPFDAEVEALDGGTITHLGPPRVVNTATAAVVTLTMTADALPSGDYVLRLRRSGDGGRPENVTTRAFRVTRD
jgi:hypothetical protein